MAEIERLGRNRSASQQGDGAQTGELDQTRQRGVQSRAGRHQTRKQVPRGRQGAMVVPGAFAKSKGNSNEVAVRQAALRQKRKCFAAWLRRVLEAGRRQSCSIERGEPGEVELWLSGQR